MNYPRGQRKWNVMRIYVIRQQVQEKWRFLWALLFIYIKQNSQKKVKHTTYTRGSSTLSLANNVFFTFPINSSTGFRT
jgi:hypothetical protein